VFAPLRYRPLPVEGERNMAFIWDADFDDVTRNYATWRARNGDALMMRARRVHEITPSA
jgi:hypothetical protein